ncbi:MAG: glycoside hydrolase domain-containing protein, partial [Phycisphaeraceae bacterium]
EGARGHLPGGELAADTLAEGYDADAFVDDAGDVLPGGDAERQGHLGERRTRWLELSLPADALREGVNVVAIQIVRAAYSERLRQAPQSDGHTRQAGTELDLSWPTAFLRRVQLTAESDAGVVPNAARPDEVQIWNSDAMAPVFDADWADRTRELAPLRLTGVRNGRYSGKVVIGHAQPIRQLSVQPAPLTEPDGAAIPASAVRVRYGHGFGSWPLTYPYTYEQTPHMQSSTYLGALTDRPAEEYPLIEHTHDELDPAPSPAVPGAVVPVWVTVAVPADAPAGTYTGELQVSVAGEAARGVPVSIEVIDWALPEPHDWQTWIELMQSPDTLALEYDVELWSDEHFELIAQSMRLMREVGARTLYVPLLAETNLGNAESMVRWVEDGEGGYTFDYTPMERYLDTALEHLGEPTIVCFVVWDIYIGAARRASAGGEGQSARALAALGDELGDGPVVTRVDADGGTSRLELPGYDEPRHWRELWRGVRERLEERDLADAAMIGILSDVWATRDEVAFWRDITGDTPWVNHSHHGVNYREERPIAGLARSGYQTRVWNISFASRADEPLHGWNRDELLAYYLRSSTFMNQTTVPWRYFSEMTITGDMRGVGRLGADYWSAVRDQRGRRRGQVWTRYPQSSWRNLDLYSHVLGPGPDGPVSTQRYEMFREGAQLAETRVYLEGVLLDDEQRAQLGDDLAQRVHDTLAERLTAIWRGSSTLRLTRGPSDYATSGTTWRGRPGIAGHAWYVSASDWQARDRQLYDLAAEVADALRQ